MRVRATAPGFYGILRIPGEPNDEFDVPDGSKATWFEPVEPTKKSRTRDEKQSDGEANA